MAYLIEIKREKMYIGDSIRAGNALAIRKSGRFSP